MESLYLSIGLAASMIGVSTKTLRRWDKKGSFSSAFRTKKIIEDIVGTKFWILLEEEGGMVCIKGIQ